MEKIFCVICTMLFFVSCITDYDSTHSVGGILVVDGTITDGVTLITLSKSRNLNSIYAAPDTVSTAKLWVECDDGALYPADEGVKDGKYYIPLNLRFESKYRLKIEFEGKQYVSEFLSPLETPEIDEISFHKAGAKQPVKVAVSTSNTEGNSRYYKWKYEEAWEYTAKWLSTAELDEITKEVVRAEPYSSMYYCWMYNHSRSMLVATSEKLSENVIDKYVLFDVPFAGNIRFSYLYYIKVYQNCIRKEAYDYFSNINKNAEATGSIFSPVPSEIRGNICCVGSEDVPVIGYVDVSYTATKEEYVQYPNELAELLYFDYSLCFELDYPKDTTMLLIPYRMGTDPDTIYYAPDYCVDCKYYGGVKAKPSFWPNDDK